MEKTLNARDYRLFAVCFVVAAVSLVTASHFFYDAFPEATIDFRITREEAGERAQTFLDSRGLDVEGYRHSAIFLYDGSAKTFLERELGLEGATALIGNPVRLWRWSNRWVRELEKEEFRVQYTTAGELAGFSHLIEEEAEGASLAQAEARALAERFLAETMGRDLAELTFVEAEITERPNRSDHTFTWKLSDFEVSEATYRLMVRIQGDQVGRYSEYLKVPEAWQREYQELRSYNEATGLVAAVLMILTWIAMLVILAQSIRARDVRWKTVAVFTAIAFALTFLAQVNTLPLTEYNFDTTETYGSFLTGHLLSALLSALGQAVLIGFLTAGAEPIYRRSYGDQVSLNQQFLPAGIRTKRFLTGTIIGLTMTALFVAYQTVFYVVADDLGAWSPAQIPYDQMVNTYIPWVVVLLIGFMPAVSEEFTSRAFSIPFLQRFLKKRWLAIVISALVWGFAHASYPQQPFYIRGIEVGLAGIAVGYVMIRWGLLPALVWHYTIDAFYTAMILLRSSNSYFVISAGLSVGIMLLPFAVALVLYVRHRFFVDPEPLLNRSESPPLDDAREARPGEAAPAPEAEPLSAPEPASSYHPPVVAPASALDRGRRRGRGHFLHRLRQTAEGDGLRRHRAGGGGRSENLPRRTGSRSRGVPGGGDRFLRGERQRLPSTARSGPASPPSTACTAATCRSTAGGCGSSGRSKRRSSTSTSTAATVRSIPTPTWWRRRLPAPTSRKRRRGFSQKLTCGSSESIRESSSWWNPPLRR